MAFVHRCMIVPASIAPAVRGLCRVIANFSGEDMFTVGLSASGSLPATHFVSSGLIDEDFANLMDSPSAAFDVAVQNGVSITLDQITGILAAATISSEDGSKVISDLGLKIID